jgi:hypothetical protein
MPIGALIDIYIDTLSRTLHRHCGMVVRMPDTGKLDWCISCTAPNVCMMRLMQQTCHDHQYAVAQLIMLEVRAELDNVNSIRLPKGTTYTLTVCSLIPCACSTWIHVQLSWVTR